LKIEVLSLKKVFTHYKIFTEKRIDSRPEFGYIFGLRVPVTVVITPITKLIEEFFGTNLERGG
jgi:hypothetical protein